jgi:capsule polysaccharide export protein KpsC/LpsZ
MSTEPNETANDLELARAAFEEATIERARAYASEGTSSEVSRRSALAANKASDARRAYEKAILAHAQVSDPGLHHLP